MSSHRSLSRSSALAVAERKGRLQARALPHLGKVQHSIDQPGPAAWRHMPGLGVQGHPDRTFRCLWRGHLRGGDCTVTVAYLDVLVPMMLGHPMPPAAIPSIRKPAVYAVDLH